jgi:hypothetical protein
MITDRQIIMTMTGEICLPIRLYYIKLYYKLYNKLACKRDFGISAA